MPCRFNNSVWRGQANPSHIFNVSLQPAFSLGEHVVPDHKHAEFSKEYIQIHVSYRVYVILNMMIFVICNGKHVDKYIWEGEHGLMVQYIEKLVKI